MHEEDESDAGCNRHKSFIQIVVVQSPITL